MNNSIKYLLFLLILLTPLFGIYEGIGFMEFNFGFEMIHVKALKIILILVLVFISIFRAFIINFKGIEFYGIILFLVGIISALFANNKEYAFAGLNFIFPFVVMFFISGIIDKAYLFKISMAVCYILILNTILQFYQMFNMPAYQGVNIFGLTGRLPGFFAISSISAIFTVFCYFLIKYHSNFGERTKKIMLGVCIISVFLSMSSAGVVLLLILLIFPTILNSKYKNFAYVLTILSMFIIFSSIDTLTGRSEGASESSFATRLEILSNQVKKASVLPVDFGKATNLAVNFNRKLEIQNDAFIADMMYTASLVNFGWYFFIITIFYLIHNVIVVFKSKEVDKKVLVLICVMVSLSVIISEIFPANYLISILGAYYLKPKKLPFNRKRINKKIEISNL